MDRDLEVKDEEIICQWKRGGGDKKVAERDEVIGQDIERLGKWLWERDRNADTQKN